MNINWLDVLRSFIWQVIGVVLLSLVMFAFTGDLVMASGISIAWALLRTFLWFPYNTLFKKVIAKMERLHDGGDSDSVIIFDLDNEKL